MSIVLKVLIVILCILAVAAVILYFWGNKMQARQAEQQAMMDSMKQTVSVLVIDKKKMKITESGLPQQAIAQVPWYGKRMKVPVVKAKVQNRIMTLLADEEPFEQLPVKTEAKVVISGIYITKVVSIRGAAVKPIVRKPGIGERIRGIFKK